MGKGTKIPRPLPAGTQRCYNVTYTLQKDRDVEQRISNVVTTLHEQRYSNMLQQRCRKVANTLFLNAIATTLLDKVATTLLQCCGILCYGD